MDGRGVRNDEILACCGHRRRFHTPVCEYWFPGTRDQVPRPCGCSALVADPNLAPTVPRQA